MAQSFRTAISFDGLASASSQAISIKVDGDSQNRVLIDAGGKITWGAGGSSAGDTTLYRNAANVLKTDDGFVAASVTVPDGGLTLGSTAVTSTASELNLVDGITAGTISASKAVIADSNKDVTGFRNVTLTGILDAINIKVNGAQGSDGQVLTSTGSGVAWEDASGGGGTPGGSNTQIQFNNSGNFGGNANLVYDGSSLITMTKSGANTGIKLDVASDTEAHSGNIAFYKSEAAGAGRLDKDAVYGQLDFYGQTASNGYHHAAAIKTLVGEYFYSDNYTPSDIEFWVTPSDQTSPVRKVVVRGGTANTDAAALEIWHNQANKGSRVDFVDDDGTQLGYFGFNANANWYMKNLTSGNMFIESEGSIAIRAEGNYEVNFSSTGLEPYADEGYKLGSSSKEWSEAYIVDLKVSGNSTMTGTLTVGVDDTGHDVKFFGATSGKYMLWDESADALIVKDTVDAVNFKVNGGQGSDGQVLTSTGSGVAWEDASGGGSPGGSNTQVQFNNSGSFGGSANLTFDGTNLTVAGELDAATLDISGDADIDGTTNLDTVQVDGALTVGVDDTGHDVIFYGATSGDKWKWDESSDSMLVEGHSFLEQKVQTGATSFTQEPWANSTIALGDYGSIGTQGSYRTYMSWNYERGTDSNYHHLDVNSYPQAGHVAIGNSGILFGYDDDFETTHTAPPTTRALVTSQGLGVGSGSGSSPSIFFTSDTDSGFYLSGSGVSFTTAGTQRMYVSTAGRTHIPQVDDVDDDAVSGCLILGGDGTGQHLAFDNNEIQSKSDATTATTLNLNLEGGNVKTKGELHVHHSGIAMTIQDTSNDTGSYIQFTDTDSDQLAYIGCPNNDDIHIKNTNTSGYIYIGVTGASNGYCAYFTNTGDFLPYNNVEHNLGASGKAWEHFFLGQANTFSSGGYYTLRSRDSDRQVMELTSSERFKKDIVDLPLDEAYQVLNARPIKYRGIEDDSSVPLEAGLSAESLHNAGYEYAVRYDEGHWGETPRSIYYEYLTAPLIKICKDQKDRIESLESKVAALEAA